MQILKANYIDIANKNIFAAAISIEKGKLKSITPINEKVENYILPGFVDAHIHIESSMLLPCEFAKIAVQHGTVATVSDPHEIANVCGMQGVQYMIDNGNKVPFKFYFGAPSCVPATGFETSGAVLNSTDVDILLQQKEIKYLSEMMNYPGVLHADNEVMKKIASAIKHDKPIDGHAPGLTGSDAIKYIQAGISTDHECTTYEEALHKLKNGMRILIREGSAAKNFDALINLLQDYPNEIMFCCDDKHPDELLLHHINHHVKRALALGINIFNVLQAACINAVKHYKLDVGLLQLGDDADCIIVNNLTDFTILQTYINGNCVFDNGKVNMPSVQEKIINNFNCSQKEIADFETKYNNEETIYVIEALDGQLITKTHIAKPTVENNKIVSNIAQDILQIVVVNRYQNASVAKAFIKNFGLQKGAIASSVAHDCHNIIAVGVDAKSIAQAVNILIEKKGGICVVNDTEQIILPLPVAGIMSNETVEKIAASYKLVDSKAKENGSKLSAPFMTLSFMALLVIPQLKLSDKGLFDGTKFCFV